MPFGGPSGGRGGNGGDVIFQSLRTVKSLAKHRGKQRLRAGDGKIGGNNNKTGRSGEDLLVELPIGTVVRQTETGRVIADLTKNEETCLVLIGGRGGRGNSGFSTSTNKAPKFRELGEEGRTLEVTIEMKLMTDVGLVGLPNAGKSTLLSRFTSATPRIADYPFTTLEPGLGVVEMEESIFTIADLPGLIRGAHQGKGLGHQFLKHIERTRMILHLVDPLSESVEDDQAAIEAELEAYGHGLDEKPRILVYTKADAAPDFLPPEGAFFISAHSGKGLDPLCFHIAEKLKDIPEPEPLAREIVIEDDEIPVQCREEDGIFIVEGSAVENYLARRPPIDLYGWKRFWGVLVRWGVSEELKRLGIQERDIVRIGEMELEYFDEE